MEHKEIALTLRAHDTIRAQVCDNVLDGRFPLLQVDDHPIFDKHITGGIECPIIYQDDIVHPDTEIHIWVVQLE